MKFRYVFSLLLVNLVFSQNYIAVVDFDGKGISDKEASTLTDRFRLELFKTGVFTVAERELMNQVLDEQGFQLSGCASNECLVEVGKMIGVSNIIGGSVSKFGEIYSVSLRMVDIEKGTIAQTAIYDHEGRFEDLLLQVMRKSAEQFASAVDPGYATAADDRMSVKESTPAKAMHKNMTKLMRSKNGLMIVGGMNNSKITYNDGVVADNVDVTSQSGIYLGLEKQLNILNVGMAINQRGANYSATIFGNLWEGTDIYNYLSIYGLYPYRFGNKAALFGGLQFSIGTGGSTELTVSGSTESSTIDAKDLSSEIGLLVGGDYWFKTRFGLRFMIYQGFTEVLTDAPEEENYKNSGSSLLLMYKL